MNKKIIAIGAILVAASVTHAQSYSSLEGGIVGAIIGAVIGNNVGDGDGTTGAIIGGTVGIITGQKDMRSHRHRGIRRQGHCDSVYYPTTRTVEVRRRVWVPERIVTNACGDVIHYVPGHYETRIEYRTIRVYR